MSTEVIMDRDLARLQQNISRIRREIRLQASEMQSLIDADLRMQADLMLFSRQTRTAAASYRQARLKRVDAGSFRVQVAVQPVTRSCGLCGQLQ